eukprot:scaffold474_cov108-Cylindrotheca_fusiformis.AAC.1
MEYYRRRSISIESSFCDDGPFCVDLVQILRSDVRERSILDSFDYLRTSAHLLSRDPPLINQPACSRMMTMTFDIQ